HVGIHTHTSKGYPALKLRVTLANTYRRAVDRFVEIVGVPGYIHTAKPDLRSNRKRTKVLYTAMWQAHGAKKVLETLLPYLVIKREQTRLGIQFRDTFDEPYTLGRGHPLPDYIRESRQDMCFRMKALKQVN
ncbi:hypothetical protein LCGC14_3168670, partial [marine sediment metagenome]